MIPEKKGDVFQAISDPTRRKILGLLVEKELPVTSISHHFTMSRPAVSKHLKILSDSRLVTVEKVGRESRYKLNPEPLNEIKDWLAYFDQYWDNKISMLKYLVENPSSEELKFATEKSEE